MNENNGTGCMRKRQMMRDDSYLGINVRVGTHLIRHSGHLAQVSAVCIHDGVAVD